MVEEIPLFPLQTVLFPGGPLPLRIFETRYIDMISRCMKQGIAFGVCLIREGTETATESIHEIGTTAKITDWNSDTDGLLNIFCFGESRFQSARTTTENDGLMMGQVEILELEQDSGLSAETEKLAQFLEDAFDQLPDYYQGLLTDYSNATWVGYRLAELLPISMSQKQYLLEINDAQRRLEILYPLMESLKMI